MNWAAHISMTKVEATTGGMVIVLDDVDLPTPAPMPAPMPAPRPLKVGDGAVNRF